MPVIEPLPYLLRLRRRKDWTGDGPRSIRYRIAGLLHLEEDTLIFEWMVTERLQSVGLLGVRDETRDFAPEAIEFPVGWIADVRLRGGWWLPRITLRARWLQAFEGMPGAEPGRVTLWIPRRHRRLAPPMVHAIELGRNDPTTPLPAPGTPPRGLRSGESPGMAGTDTGA